MGRFREWIGEQWPIPYLPSSLVRSGSALRGVFSEAFRGVPSFQKTTVDYYLARALYRNDDPQYNLGAGFVRPIIDLTVEYVGLPEVTTSESDQTVWLNECIQQHWAPELLQAYRDSLRDSKTYVRFRQPRTDNPLFTEDDRMHGRIEIIPPENVELSWNPADPDLLDQAVVHHEINFDERTEAEVVQGNAPRFKTHHILEIISPRQFRFYDKTDERELGTWTTGNSLKFVPIWPAFNEYAADLGGGQSDIEPVLPFIQAFHEVLLQTLAAHKYHSTPKAKFNVKNVMNFLANNFPDVIGPDGKLLPGAKVNWSGREIMFFESDEDAGFIEAKSVLGDSKTLLDFLIDCIAIAAEIPKWAMVKDQGATDKDATVQPFDKKINRKRMMFTPFIQMICKMALVARGASPETVRLVWPAIRLTDLAAKAQSVQQIIMGLDVAKTNRWIADDTAILILKSLFDQINDPATEKKMAVDNYVPPIPAPAPASATQALPPPAKNGNGGGNKTAARRAVATTQPSRS
jgi:hypothetical protein